MSDPDPVDSPSQSYLAALGELDTILAALDSDEVDVDRLADLVRRAGELLALCRERIAGADAQVEQVLLDLAGPEGDEADR